MSVSAKLCLKIVSKQGVAALWNGSKVNKLVFLVSWPFGVFKICQQFFNPSAWCEAALMTLCRRRGDSHSSWGSFLVESGIKVTEELGVSLSG